MTTRCIRPARRPAARRPGASTTLALGLLAAVLVGCGSAGEQEEGSDESRPSSGASQDPGQQPDGLPAIVSASQGGGSTDMDPVVIESAADVEELTAGLEAGLPELVESRVQEARAMVPDGHALVGQVVWVGCETPTDVQVEGTTRDPSLTAVVPGKGSTQCLVPVTTVALGAVPQE